jgi:protocatechuate 3,4-dioxygenase beta subunit
MFFSRFFVFIFFAFLNLNSVFAGDSVNNAANNAANDEASSNDSEILFGNKLNVCKKSKEYINNYEPKVFNKSNNLLRLVGGVEVFKGNKIALFGRIVDKKCQPIKYTKVLIWQVGEDYKYPYAFLRSSANESMSSILDFRKRSTFLGSGTTFSDNNGEFKFVSVFPGAIGKEAPYVNIRIEADGYSFQTKVYLGRNVVNAFYNDSNLNYTMFDGVVFPLRNLSDKAGYRVYKFQICIE